MSTGPGPGTGFPKEPKQALGPRKHRKASAKARKPASEPERASGAKRRGEGGRSELSPWAKELWEWGRTLVVAVVVVLGLHYFVFSLSTVEGRSMQPTLYEKEWLFVNKLSYRTGSPGLGDVVILKDPAPESEREDYLVKRIVGMPGDRIEIRQGELYRNGKLVVEPYTDVLIEDEDFGPVDVPVDHYFIMGDNRHASASRDSRSFQAVPRSAILGRADLILWPITQWAAL
ncbi:signal peptidase I [Paenibacillus sp. UNC496MF]|uniref:signal peptidase I n=1 Tax=Paenibacillus sp. UNC496MF TaxID=1502753 RepID=UPI0008E132AA|nr:signal peptidase I [Paenibacillus sp. UNC496MF]SFI72139.1 signal peptidase I [Paenibacillus sp. UNC496MF]